LYSKTAGIMGRKRKFYGRKPSKTLGHKLRKWRDDAELTLEDAAKRLGIKCKSPGSYLWQMENARKTVPEKILINVPQVYEKTEEEVLKCAYYPQLHFPMLTEMLKPTALPKKIDDFLDNLIKRLEEKEKIEIAKYASYLLTQQKLKRPTANSV
jgi:transcriptional regulator with XRE-family HTH domain